MGEVAASSSARSCPASIPRRRPYFSDVLDHVRRVQALVDGLREVLNSVFEFANLLEQQRTGVDHPPARRLGRDPRRPDRDRRHLRDELRAYARAEVGYGYFVVLAAIALICVGLYLRFKRARWL